MGMLKRLLCLFALSVLLQGSIALGAGIDFATLVPCGVYDDAAVMNGALVSTNDTVSRYAAALAGDMGNPRLRIRLSVEIAHGSSVHFAFGGESCEDFLRIECDGRWKVRIGDGDIQGFGENPTPFFTGTRIFNLELSFNAADKRLTEARGSGIDGALSPSGFDLPPSLWQGMGGDIALWRHASVSLSGSNASALSMDCATIYPPTLIILR